MDITIVRDEWADGLDETQTEKSDLDGYINGISFFS